MKNINVISLDPSRWPELRELRLAALQTNPEAFASTHAAEIVATNGHWIDWLTRTQASKKDFLRFAEYNNTLVGMIGAHLDEEQENAKLISMFVMPQYREKGIGALLLQGICQSIAENLLIKYIYLKVNTRNEKAIDLYEKFGFEKIEKMPAYGKPFDEEWFMIKRVR